MCSDSIIVDYGHGFLKLYTMLVKLVAFDAAVKVTTPTPISK